MDVLEDDLYKEASIDVICRACVSGFNVPSMACESLELERGPSIEPLDEIKNLNGKNHSTLASFRTVNSISPISQNRIPLEVQNSVIWWENKSSILSLYHLALLSSDSLGSILVLFAREKNKNKITTNCLETGRGTVDVRFIFNRCLILTMMIKCWNILPRVLRNEENQNSLEVVHKRQQLLQVRSTRINNNSLLSKPVASL